jgi:hypothetical protein
MNGSYEIRNSQSKEAGKSFKRLKNLFVGTSSAEATSGFEPLYEVLQTSA